MWCFDIIGLSNKAYRIGGDGFQPPESHDRQSEPNGAGLQQTKPNGDRLTDHLRGRATVTANHHRRANKEGQSGEQGASGYDLGEQKPPRNFDNLITERGCDSYTHKGRRTQARREKPCFNHRRASDRSPLSLLWICG